MRFAKLHGLGNDFLLVASADVPAGEMGQIVRRICDRHTGVGADGFIAWNRSGDVVAMHLHNADGSRAEVSGNGLRCLAAWLHLEGLAGRELMVETPAGRRSVEVLEAAGSCCRVRVELGAPILGSREIPMDLDPPRDRVVDHRLALDGGETASVTALSMGNPHCVVFVDAPPDDATLERVGRALEVHPAFPSRCNVELIHVASEAELRVRLWERGVGRTNSSGTGAASACVAAALRGMADRRVRVVCDGGVLDCEWAKDGVVWQTGEAQLVCQGEWLGP